MRLVKLYQVPQGSQVVIQDLGLIGMRKSPSSLDPKIIVEIELVGETSGKKRSHYAFGSTDAFVDDSVALLTK